MLEGEFSRHLRNSEETVFTEETVKAGNGEGKLKFYLLTLLFRMESRQTSELCVPSGSAVNSPSWPSELREVMWCLRRGGLACGDLGREDWDWLCWC